MSKSQPALLFLSIILLSLTVQIQTPHLQRRFNPPRASFSQSVSSPDIRLDLTTPQEVGECIPSTFSITVKNVGNGTVQDLNVTNEMPEGFRYQDGSGRVNGTPVDPSILGRNLTWNLGDLPVNSSYVIEFNLTAGCSAKTGAIDRAFAEYSNGTHTFYKKEESPGIKVLHPVLVVYKEPVVVPAHKGDQVSWVVRVRNEGFSLARNVTILDNLGNGLSLDAIDPPQNGTFPNGTLYWTNITLDVGDEFRIELNVTVVGCENLTNEVKAHRTCFGEVCLRVDGIRSEPPSSLSSVELIKRPPKIVLTSSSLNPSPVDPCIESNLTLTFTNQGSGDACFVNITLELAPPLQYVDGTGNPPPTVNGNVLTFHLGNMSSGESKSLSLNLIVPCGAGGSVPILIRTEYLDECFEPWKAPSTFVNVDTSSPGISVSKDGPHEIINTSQGETYTINISCTGLSLCQNPYVIVVDRIPQMLTYVSSNPAGFYDPVTNTVTWNLSASSNIQIQLILKPSPSASCGEHGMNEVNATLYCCDKCKLSASASLSVRVTCSEVPDDCFQIRTTANRTSVEPCKDLNYTSTITFWVDGVNSTFSNMLYTHCEEDGLPEDYVGPAYLYLPNGSVVVLTPPQQNSTCILWNLSKINFLANSGDTIRITYVLRVRCDAPGFLHDKTGFYMKARNSTGADLNCKGSAHWAVYIPVSRPILSISENFPPMLDLCREYEYSIRGTGASDSNPAYNVTIRKLVPDDFIYNSTTLVKFDNGTSLWVNPYFENGWLKWNSSNVPQFSKVTCDFTVEVNMTACYNRTPGFKFKTEASWIDYCEFIGACKPNCVCTHNTSIESGPVRILKPEFIVLKTPEIIYAITQQVRWRIQFSNSGNGTAYSPAFKLEDLLGEGLRFVSADLPAGWSVSVSPDGRNVTFTSDKLPAGDTVEFNLTAKMVKCTGLTNNVTAYWGCCGKMLPLDFDNSSVEVPDAVVTLTDHLEPRVVELCQDQRIKVYIKNSGKVAVYNCTLNYTLPECFYYNKNVQAYVNGTPFNPNQSGDRWALWNFTSTSFSELLPGKVLEIVFNATASCPCDKSKAGGYAAALITYSKACTMVVGPFNYTGTSMYSLSSPDIYLSAPSYVCANVGTNVWWNITIKNRGDGTAYDVNITVELPPSTTYISAIPTPSSVSGRVLTWLTQYAGGPVPDIPPGGSFEIDIRVKVDDCVPQDYLKVFMEDGCPGCYFEREWYNSTTYMHSQPFPPKIHQDLEPLNVCANATYKIMVRNEDPCLTLYATPQAGNYVLEFSDILPQKVSYRNLPGDWDIIFHDNETNTNSSMNSFTTFSYDPVTRTLKWTLTMPSFEATPGDYFLIKFNVTSQECDLEVDNNEFRAEKFTDECGNQLSATSVEKAPILLPELWIRKTPREQYKDLYDLTCWNVRVGNSGNGTAYNVTIWDVLCEAFSFDQAAQASTTPWDLVYIPGINTTSTKTTIVWKNKVIPPGGSVSLVVCGNITVCPVPPNHPYDDAYANWGCDSYCNYSKPVHAHADVYMYGVPSPLDKSPTSFNVCGNSTIEILIKNVGATMFGVCINETLPFGLEPLDVQGGNVLANVTLETTTYYNVPSNYTVASPGDYTRIVWNLTKLRVHQGETLTLRFRVHANCSFDFSTEYVNVTYWDSCGELYSMERQDLLKPLRPDLSTSYKEKVSPSGRVDRFQAVKWEIHIVNSGDGELYFLNVSDFLGGDFKFVSASPAPNWTDNPADPHVFNWSFNWAKNPLPPNGEFVITIEANFTTCANSAWNNASLTWWCDSIACAPTSWANSTIWRAAPDLDVQYSSPAYLICGNTTVTFKATNIGDGSIFGFNSSMPLTLRHFMPVNATTLDCMEYVSGTTNITFSNGTVIHPDPTVVVNATSKYLEWNLSWVRLYPGDWVEVSFLVRTSCCFRKGLEGSAYAGGYDLCGSFYDNREADSADEIAIPDLTLSKTPADRKVDRWSLVSWIMEVTNLGNGTANFVNLTDILTGLTYVSDNATMYRVSSGPNKVVWNITKIPPGEKVRINLTANVTGCYGIRDDVWARWGCMSIKCEEETDRANVSLLWPNISISKKPVGGTCPVQVEPGDVITFEILLDNTGEKGTAYNLTVVDEMPSFMDFVNASDGGTYDLVSHTTTWHIQKLENTTKTIYLTLSTRPGTPDGASEINNVTVTYLDACGNTHNPETGAPYRDDAECRMVTVAAPEIRINKTMSENPVNMCDNVTITLLVRNIGHGTAYSTNVTDVLPPGFEYVQGSTEVRNETTGALISTEDPQVRRVSDGIELHWPLDLKLWGGEAITVEFNVTTGCGLTSGLDTYSAECKDGGGYRKTDSGSILVKVLLPELKIEKAPKTQESTLGSEVEWFIMVKNVGNGTAYKAEVKDILGSGYRFVEANGTYVVKGNTVSWNLSLGPGSSETFLLRAEIVKCSGLTNEATVRWFCKGTCGTSYSKAHTTLKKPSLHLDKEFNRHYVVAGEVVNVTIRVWNDGKGEGRDLIVLDCLPECLEFVKTVSVVDGERRPVKHSEEVSGNKVRWRIPSLGPKEQVIITFSARCCEQFPDGKTEYNMTNCAYANLTGGCGVYSASDCSWIMARRGPAPPPPPSPTPSPTPTPTPTPSPPPTLPPTPTPTPSPPPTPTPTPPIYLVHEKLPSKGLAVVGEKVSFSILVTNKGSEDVFDVLVIDTLPKGMDYVVGSSTIDGESIEPTVEGRELRWKIPVLKAGETVTIRYEVVVQNTALKNQVTLGKVRKETFIKAFPLTSFLTLLILPATFFIRKKPVVVDYEFLKRNLKSFDFLLPPLIGRPMISRLTLQKCLDDAEIEEAVTKLVSAGTLKVIDLPEKAAQFSDYLVDIYGLSKEEADSLSLAISTGASCALLGKLDTREKAFLLGINALGCAGSISLLVRRRIISKEEGEFLLGALTSSGYSPGLGEVKWV